MPSIKWHTRVRCETQHPLAVHIGNQLLKLREDRQLSGPAVQALCGVSTASIYQIEAGCQVPGTETLFRLARFYEVSIDSLLAGYEEQS